MNEFVLALWAMAASHHQWEMPPKEPVATIQPLETRSAARELSVGERRELRTAVEHMARCATGMLRPDAESGWYIPEQKPAGSCARSLISRGQHNFAEGSQPIGLADQRTEDRGLSSF